MGYGELEEEEEEEEEPPSGCTVDQSMRTAKNYTVDRIFVSFLFVWWTSSTGDIVGRSIRSMTMFFLFAVVFIGACKCCID